MPSPLADHIAASKSSLPMWHQCTTATCYGFAPQPRSLCHNCLLDEKAANDADLAREWAHLMGF